MTVKRKTAICPACFKVRMQDDILTEQGNICCVCWLDQQNVTATTPASVADHQAPGVIFGVKIIHSDGWYDSRGENENTL